MRRSVVLRITRWERNILDQMKATGALSTDGDVIRVALYRLAVHLEIRIDPEIFHVRSGRPRARSRGAA